MSSDQKKTGATTATTTSSSTDATPGFQLNQKKLKELAENAQAIKIGGKGTARRKKKIIHRPANADDKKLQSSLKKLAANNIQGIEEVNMFKDNGEVIHFTSPKVQASLGSNTYAISGPSDTKSLQEMLPTIMSQMGISTDSGSASEAGRRKFGTRGDQSQPGNEPESAEADDEEVPDNMLHIRSIFALNLLIICVNCKDKIPTLNVNRTIVSSRSIYDLVQARRVASRLAAYHNRTHRKNHPNAYFSNANIDYIYSQRSQTNDLNSSHQQFFSARFKIVIIFSAITLISMIAIIITCIVTKYYRSKNPATVEQREPLNQTRRTIVFSNPNYDQRIFTRKPRAMPTEV
ncbi:unnamed protein product [Adineta ricciae]|uniref:Transcription factor BTF3 n=1 Tax=Adineta ricciae TaxID=249248 RepID=A0A814C225_ADIRI|nr:unnamed protein product [Adineta ricciae]